MTLRGFVAQVAKISSMHAVLVHSSEVMRVWNPGGQMSHGQVPGQRWEKGSCQSFVCMKALQQLHRTHLLFPLHQTVPGICTCRGPEVKIVFRCNAFCQPKRDIRMTLKSIDQDGLFFPIDIVFFYYILSQILFLCHYAPLLTHNLQGFLEDM